MTLVRELRGAAWCQDYRPTVTLSKISLFVMYGSSIVGFRIVSLRDTRFVAGGNLPKLHYSPNFGYPWLRFRLVAYKERQ